jgi:hypothetical protein
MYNRAGNAKIKMIAGMLADTECVDVWLLQILHQVWRVHISDTWHDQMHALQKIMHAYARCIFGVLDMYTCSALAQ